MVLPGYWYYPARAKNIQNFGASSTIIVILLFRRYGRRNFRPNFFSAEKISAEIFSAENFFGRLFFSWGGLGGRSRPNHFKKFAKANFLKWCRGGACPPRNLRYPCLAPRGGLGGFAPQESPLITRALPPQRPCLAPVPCPQFFFFRPNFFVRRPSSVVRPSVRQADARPGLGLARPNTTFPNNSFKVSRPSPPSSSSSSSSSS